MPARTASRRAGRPAASGRSRASSGKSISASTSPKSVSTSCFAALMRAERRPRTWAMALCQLAFAFALNDVEDGFGLGKVDPAVQEGPFGELAGFGEPCALPHHEGKDQPLDGRPAVGVDLRHGRPGVSARRPHKDGKYLVKVGL